MQIPGIDVALWQGAINWPEVAASGVRFAYIKATQGTLSVFDRYEQNRQVAKAAGLIVGAYHYFNPKQDAGAQANHFVKVANVQVGDLPPALDLEEPALGIKPADLVSAVEQWCAIVGAACGAMPIIYTSPYYAQAALGGDVRLAKYKLWVSHYTAAQVPIVPKPWISWALWQHSSTGKVPGIVPDCDLNWCAGDVASLVIKPQGEV